MAVDTRPYKSKEQDGNGNEIILRDQQLVEQASQTTMASTEYFEIVDVDGRMAKIPKDKMISVVREALGSLLNGLSDQTTVTKIPTLNGNTLGASAAATLASVLGVVNTKISSGTRQIDSEGNHVLIPMEKNKRYFVVVTERGANKYVVGIVFNKDLSSYGDTVVVAYEGLYLSGSSSSGEWLENLTPNAIIDFLLIEF